MKPYYIKNYSRKNKLLTSCGIHINGVCHRINKICNSLFDVVSYCRAFDRFRKHDVESLKFKVRFEKKF